MTSARGLPATIGGLVVERRLGQGGMGEVLLAHDPASGRRVAVKVLAPGASADVAARFLREGEAQARADAHPHVLRVHRAGQQDGQPYLVLELAEGGDLAGRLRAGPLPVPEAVRVVDAVADAVAHVHRRGVLHRDLKPGNVLFDAGGRPLVTDFGLAKVTGGQSLTRTGQLLGTPAYMAPEQVEDASRVDERTDIYALGALLHACLTGGPPFDADSLTSLLNAVLHRPAPGPRATRPEVSPALDALARRALAKDPADRPPSAAAFRAELARAARGGASSGRGRALAAGALAAAALAAVGVVAAARRGGSPAAPTAAPAPPTEGAAVESAVAATPEPAAPPRWTLVPGEPLRYRFTWDEASRDASASHLAGDLVLTPAGDPPRWTAAWELTHLAYGAKNDPTIQSEVEGLLERARGRVVLAFTLTPAGEVVVLPDDGVDPAADLLELEGLRLDPAMVQDAQAMRAMIRGVVGAVFRPPFVTALLRALLAPGRPEQRWAWRPVGADRWKLQAEPGGLPPLVYTCSDRWHAIAELALKGELRAREGRPAELGLRQVDRFVDGGENVCAASLVLVAGQ